MPTGKIAVFGLGLIGRRMPFVSAAYLHFCENKLKVIKLPSKNNVLSDIIEQRTFGKIPDIGIFYRQNFKSLVNIYKSAQRKYYPEKDIYQKGEI